MEGDRLWKPRTHSHIGFTVYAIASPSNLNKPFNRFISKLVYQQFNEVYLVIGNQDQSSEGIVNNFMNHQQFGKGNDHTILNTPVFVRSPKLSNVERGWVTAWEHRVLVHILVYCFYHRSQKDIWPTILYLLCIPSCKWCKNDDR